jgi:hypothetical protein
MASLIEELQRREAAARQEVDELRGEIAQLGERLARGGGEPTRNCRRLSGLLPG